MGDNHAMVLYHWASYWIKNWEHWLKNLILAMPSCPNTYDNYIIVRKEISFHDSFLRKRGLGATTLFVRDLMNKLNTCDKEFLGKPEELKYFNVLKQAASFLQIIQAFMSHPSSLLELLNCQRNPQ